MRLPIQELAGVGSLRIDSESMVAVLPDGHRLGGRDAVSIDDLAREPLILFPRNLHPLQYDTLIGQFYRASGVEPRVALEEPEEQDTLLAVAAGCGVGLITESRAKCTHIRGTAYRPLALPGIHTDLGLAWRLGEPSAFVPLFLGVARELTTSARG